jgi:hypothetical protein
MKEFYAAARIGAGLVQSFSMRRVGGRFKP